MLGIASNLSVLLLHESRCARYRQLIDKVSGIGYNHKCNEIKRERLNSEPVVLVLCDESVMCCDLLSY